MWRYLVLVMALAGGLLGQAARAETLELSSAVFKDVEHKAKDGRVERRRAPATTVVPGDRIVYVLTYRNTAPRPAERLVITNPLPGEVQYLSPTGEAPEVSVDSGQSFGALAALTVPNADGTQRPADPKDVTHVRWRINGAVPPGQSGEVSFYAVLR